MAEEIPFFDTAALGRTQPKVRARHVDGGFVFDWDETDPELIAAGINDMTVEDWSAVSDRLAEEAANFEEHQENQPRGFK